MRIEYSLSNAQRKELLIRGKPLSICIPLDDSDDPDPMQFAKQAMPDDAESITSAEIAVLWIAPAVGATGLTGLIGRINEHYDELASVGKIPIPVEVVIVQMMPARPRQKPAGINWPNGRCIIDGKTIYSPEQV